MQGHVFCRVIVAVVLCSLLRGSPGLQITPLSFLGFLFDRLCPPAAAFEPPCLPNVPDVLFLILHLISPLLLRTPSKRFHCARRSPELQHPLSNFSSGIFLIDPRQPAAAMLTSLIIHRLISQKFPLMI